MTDISKTATKCLISKQLEFFLHVVSTKFSVSAKHRKNEQNMGPVNIKPYTKHEPRP